VGGLDIWWVHLPDIEYQVLFDCYASCLSQQEYQRLQSRRLPKGQFQFLFTRIVLRHLLSAYHPLIAPVQWQVNRSESGRPYLLTAQTPLSFNLTHTNDCLVFAFSQFADPGIDVECLSRAVEYENIAQRYFATQEYCELKQLPKAEQVEFFYRLWTLKEAAVKASGLGLARGLRQFQFSQPSAKSLSHLISTDSEKLAGDFRFWSACFQGYVLGAALSAQSNKPLPDIAPVSRRLSWPDVSADINLNWLTSQSRNSSTNLEP
jgi:4'-phosphopantetheinyl transferase